MQEIFTRDQNLAQAAGPKAQPPGLTVKLAGGFAALAWMATFGAGLLINSQPYRDKLVGGFDWYTALLCLITYTPTNISFLCMFAALLGGCASRLSYETQPEHFNDAEMSESYAYLTENPINSMLRGLLVFFLFLAGVYAGSEAPFATTTPNQFARAAGVVSMLAFAVGYDPTIFKSIINFAGRLKNK